MNRQNHFLIHELIDFFDRNFRPDRNFFDGWMEPKNPSESILGQTLKCLMIRHYIHGLTCTWVSKWPRSGRVCCPSSNELSIGKVGIRSLLRPFGRISLT